MENFYCFVSGHSSLELMGIVISGMAGLKLGFALFSPGEMRRIDSLMLRATEGVKLLYGAATMTFLAAFIEDLTKAF